MLLDLLRSLKGAKAAPPAAAQTPDAHVATAPAHAEPRRETDDPLAAARAAEQRGDIEGALHAYREHAMRHPDDPWALATCGGILVQYDRLDEAEALLRPALRRFPAFAPLCFNLGRVAHARMRLDEAVEYLRLALAADPAFAMARALLATVLMLKGEYREALLLFRARGDVTGAPADAWPRNLPRWEGQPLQGKRLLVWLDWGGLGDELQFARFLAPLARDFRPARLIFGCSREGLRLYTGIPGVDEACPELVGVEVDYQIPLIDLAVIYQVTPQHMPALPPYLTPPAAPREMFAQKLAGVPGRRVGLCWGTGFWGQTSRSDRAIPLPDLAPLAQVPGMTLVCLQKGIGRDDLPCPQVPMLDFDTDIADMADTAALVANLDLVVTVDTSVAHLAGALGKPVLVMMRWESGTFFLLDREDNPWYPSMRVVRQRSKGDWAGVIRRICELLSTPGAP